MYKKQMIMAYFLITVTMIGMLFNFGANNDVSAAPPDYVWGQVPIGGGGYVTGVEIHPNNKDLVYVRTDVGGAYRWDAATDSLVQLLEKEITYDNKNWWGIESLALDRNNQNIVYVAVGKNPKSCGCDILKSTDKGKSWTSTNLSDSVQIGGNAVGRWSGERLVVDPNNSNIIYFASRYDGLWKNKNGSWSKINNSDFNYSGTPSEQNRGLLSFVAFDPNSNNNGNQSETIYVGAFGKGVYRSTNGGASFSKMGGSPTNPERGVVASNGTLYVTHTNGVSKFTGNWVNITPPRGNREFSGLDVYKGNPNIVVVAERDGGRLGNNRVYRSTDGGSNWSETSKEKNNLSFDLDETWGTGQNWSTATADLAIDPTNPKKIWLTSWFGLWRTNDITAGTRHWKPIEAGHEELVTHDLISPSSGANLISGMADQGGFRHTDPLNSAPSERMEESQLQAANRPRIQDTEGLDWAENKPNLIVRVGGRYWPGASQAGLGQYSNDNGRNWTPFPTTPQNNTAKGGLVAVSADGTHVVWLPQNSKPYASSTMGNGWTPSLNITPSNLIHSRWSPKQILAADRVIEKRFYLLDYRNKKFYRSDDGGFSWQLTDDIDVNTDVWDNQIVKARPGMGGDVWVSSESKGLFRSTKGGREFSRINNVQKVVSFDFGAPKPGTTTPTIFLYGKANGDSAYGIYRSDNLAGTWENIMGDWTMSNGPKSLAGDRQIYGRLYIGTGGTGIYYGDLQGETPPPSDNLIKNGSFEAGSPDEWELKKNGGSNASLTTDSGTRTDGSRSAKVTVSNVTGTAWHLSLQQDQFAVTNGQTYCLTFDVKGSQSGNITVEVMRDQSDWRKIGLSQPVSVGTSWNTISLPFTATETQSNSRLNISIGQKTRTLWFDDVILKTGNCTARPPVPPPPPPANNLFEVGSVTQAQADKNTWYTVNLQRSYNNPVVVMGVPSSNASDPLTMSVRNITSNSFQYQFDEWDYSNGGHAAETAAYIVMEAGTHTIDGRKWHAATINNVTHAWKSASLPNGMFGSGATLLAQVVANNNGESAVTPRIRNFMDDSFQVRVQEEQANDDQHVAVNVGTITTWSGGNAMGNYWMKAGTDGAVNDGFSSGEIEFGRTFNNPFFFAQITSYVGADTAALRYQSLTSTGVQIKLEEEKSADTEVGHINETVKWLVIGQ